MPQFVFHLLPNAHLDPVWLWDWREGMTEALTTCRAMLDLMEEEPELTFVRGEAAVYDFIEKNDPELFDRIRARVREGRWDVVGGTWIQPDTNLPATEFLLRHFEVGRAYFASRFGKSKTPTVAWAADSFGHSAGLPEILVASGMEAVAFCRPGPELVPLPKPVFWWEGCAGSRILACRPTAPYLSERGQVPELLDKALEEAFRHGLRHVAFPYGVGDHGGGPTRRQIRDIAQWSRAHPEVRVMHSGWHRFFADTRRELSGKGLESLPVHHGELNFCLRGCYASVAKFKIAYRNMEARLVGAENLDTVVHAAGCGGRTFTDTAETWRTALFNSFHDILPGSSIERAYEDQLAQVGSVVFDTQKMEASAVLALATQIDTRVPKPKGDHPGAVPLLVWNPRPFPYDGPVELEVPLDYRPLFEYQGCPGQVPLELLDASRQPLPFQVVATEHAAFESVPWRKRVVTNVKIPAFGWKILQLGWVRQARSVAVSNPVEAPRKGVIDNGIYRVEAKRGNRGLRISHRGKPVFDKGGLGVALFADPWGSWGGMLEEPGSFQFAKPMETWKIGQVETLERGPLRSVLWVRFEGKNSWLELTIVLCRGREAVDVQARLLFNERSARLKMILPMEGEAEFEVPGGRAVRQRCGEVPGGRWVRVMGEKHSLGFASDALYSFDLVPGAFRPTLARATRYAATGRLEGTEKPWRPAVDCGELKFHFLLQPGDHHLEGLAEQLEQPPVAWIVPPTKGAGRGRSGSFGSLTPATIRLLSLHPMENGLLLRLQSTAARKSAVAFKWLGQPLRLGALGAGEIGLWKLWRSNGVWKQRRLSPGR